MAPQFIRSDNGPELVAKLIRGWLNQTEVGPLFIAKGSPWENGYVESFNARLRDELLKRELFSSVTEAQWVVDRWRNNFNHHRPHSSEAILYERAPYDLSLGRYIAEML